MTLVELKPKQRAKILKINGHEWFVRRVTEMGIIPDKKITYLRSGPFKDPMHIQIENCLGSSFMFLRRSDAANIECELI